MPVKIEPVKIVLRLGIVGCGEAAIDKGRPKFGICGSKILENFRKISEIFPQVLQNSHT
jgi:hypothetical protein